MDNYAELDLIQEPPPPPKPVWEARCDTCHFSQQSTGSVRAVMCGCRRWVEFTQVG